MDAVEHLGQPVLAAPRDRLLAKRDPLDQHLAQRLLHRPPVDADHGQVDGRGGLQAGVRQERSNQVLLRHAARLGLDDQAHRRVLARFVAHAVEQRQHGCLELLLLLRERLLAGLDLGVADVLDFFQHLLRRHARRQLGDDQLPLAARQVFDLPARAHLQAAAPALVGVLNVGRTADDLPAAGVIRAGYQAKQLCIGKVRVLHQGDTGIRHLAQVVAGDLGRQAHGNAAGAVQESKRQACRQLAGLLRRSVVVGLEVHRAHVDLGQQQAGDARQARLGVAHGSRAVAVAAAKVALAVDQRVALVEVLRQAHQRVVGRLVAVGVKTPQHVAHHARAFHGLGRGVAIRPAPRQAHALHGVQNAPLHRLHAVADIGQGAAFDHGKGVFQIGALGVAAQAVVGGRGGV